MPKFLLKFNAAVIKEIPISKESVTVGRKEDNDIVVDNPAVSGHHCKIYVSGDSYFVEDLGSTNGTSVNGKRIIRSGLRHKDVIGIVQHALIFLDDRQAQEPSPPPSALPASTETAALPPDRQEDLASQSAQAAQEERLGTLRVVQGIVEKPEYVLRNLSTYIGKSDRAQIPIKGSGIFGNAPEVAAMVARRPEGYYLVAVKEGYPKLNGKALSGKELLKHGDLIELGATKLQFFMNSEK